MIPFRPRAFLLGAVCAFLCACQEGGESKNASSEVKLAVDHHMMGFGGLTRFTEGFPLEENSQYTDSATLHFKDNGNYSLTRPGQRESTDDRYFLSKAGGLTITVAQQRRSALRWPGFYDLKGDGFFFVSRSASFLRLFFGVRQISGTPALEGKWHVFGDTIVFADESDKPAHERVGRAFAGAITMDKNGKITSGSWKNSADRTVLVDGLAKPNKLGFTDFSLKLTNGFAPGRTFTGGIAKHTGTLIDRVTSGNKTDEKNVGLLLLVRQLASGLDLKRVTGKWVLGLHAIFNRPGQSGADVATATLELGSDKTWSLKFDQGGLELGGTFALGNAGDLTLTNTKGRTQVFPAAIDPDYRNIVIVDRTVESGGNPWVGVFFGVKEVE